MIYSRLGEKVAHFQQGLENDWYFNQKAPDDSSKYLYPSEVYLYIIRGTEQEYTGTLSLNR